MVPFVFALLMICLGMTALVRATRTTRPHDARDDEDGNGDGGSPVRLTPRPWEPCGEGDPPWWPEFEREFEDYAAACLERCDRGAPAALAQAAARR